MCDSIPTEVRYTGLDSDTRWLPSKQDIATTMMLWPSDRSEMFNALELAGNPVFMGFQKGFDVFTRSTSWRNDLNPTEADAEMQLASFRRPDDAVLNSLSVRAQASVCNSLHDVPMRLPLKVRQARA